MLIDTDRYDLNILYICYLYRYLKPHIKKMKL
jgi:hypothetical protein